MNDYNREELIEKFTDFITDTQKTNEYTITHHKLRDNFIGKYITEVEIGGSSGGNCWNDDPSNAYSVDSSERADRLSENIISHFQYFLKDIGFVTDLQVTAQRLADDMVYSPFDEYSNNEYYGNYTTYGLFSVDLRDVFKKTLDGDTYDLFEKSLASVKEVEDPLILKTELMTQKEELTQVLNAFDSSKARDKKQIKAQLDKLQKMYDEFDSNIDSQKKTLQKQFNDVEKKLDKLENPNKGASKKKIK